MDGTETETFTQVLGGQVNRFGSAGLGSFFGSQQLTLISPPGSKKRVVSYPPVGKPPGLERDFIFQIGSGVQLSKAVKSQDSLDWVLLEWP